MSTQLYTAKSQLLPTLLKAIEYYKDDPESVFLLENLPTHKILVVPEITIYVDVKRKVLRVYKVYPLYQQVEEFPLNEKRVVPLRKLWSIPRGRWLLAHLTGGVIFKRKGYLKQAPDIVWGGGLSGGVGG